MFTEIKKREKLISSLHNMLKFICEVDQAFLNKSNMILSEVKKIQVVKRLVDANSQSYTNVALLHLKQTNKVTFSICLL